MPKKPSFLRLFTETGPLVAFAVAFAIGIAAPASAQFFNFGGPRPAPSPAPAQRGPGGWFGGDLFAPFQQQAPKRIENYSKAPPPEKRDVTTIPERNILVLGDAMADWLAYGLEDAYAEQPDMGVLRRHKTVSGLIQYQPRGEPADWAAAAKTILSTEKPDVIVVMLGLNDRVAMREQAVEKSDAKSGEKGGEKAGDKKNDKKEAHKGGEAKGNEPAEAAKPGEKPQDAEPPADD